MGVITWVRGRENTNPQSHAAPCFLPLFLLSFLPLTEMNSTHTKPKPDTSCANVTKILSLFLILYLPRDVQVQVLGSHLEQQLERVGAGVGASASTLIDSDSTASPWPCSALCSAEPVESTF